MCGIVGYLTNEGMKNLSKREKFMRQALIMDTLRGRDSAGVFGVIDQHTRSNSAGWLKQLGSGMELVDSEDYSEFEKSVYKYCIGHNRAATVGDVTLDNAHPFQEGPITLVHNGSLWGTGLLPRSMKELGVSVDSHAICHNLAIAPAEDVITRLDGAFALVWHDDRDDTLNIVRNHERPLHMAQVRGENTILIMSEAEMLFAIASRLKISLEDIVFPRAGQWLKFNADDINNPEIKELDVSTNYRGTSWYTGGYYTPPAKNYETYPFEFDEEDDDYDNVIKLHPKGQRSPQIPASGDNRVHVGGIRRPVPTRAQEMLLDLDLLVESRLTFVPISASQTLVKGRAVISGYAGTSGLTAVLYNIHKSLFDRSRKRTWIVRPIAVKYMTEDEPCVICKIVSTRGKDLVDRSYVKPEDPEPFIKGANGVYVTASEFARQVGHGCVQCGRPICTADAMDLEWVNEGQDPMCPGCVMEYSDNYGDVDHGEWEVNNATE